MQKLPLSTFQSLCYGALLAGAREVAPDVQYDELGYVANWRNNLMIGLPLEAVEADLDAGAGRELDWKMRAAHSSAALVVNSFATWRMSPGSLSLAGQAGFNNLRFEVTIPTGLGGTSPHLDVLAMGGVIVAIESKCTEWMSSKPAKFSSSYDQLEPALGGSPWFEEMRALRSDPRKYQFLDAPQLIKHAFGLHKRFGRQDIRLMYLFWEPANSSDWEPCLRHRAEAERLARDVSNSHIRLVPMSYSELWAEWRSTSAAPHLTYLSRRYQRRLEWTVRKGTG